VSSKSVLTDVLRGCPPRCPPRIVHSKNLILIFSVRQYCMYSVQLCD
jgi:hypothetical protein